jgi:lipoyl(octanoyl) transferase
MTAPLVSRWLGRTAYTEALAMQDRLQAARIEGAIGDTLLQLEHPHVYTVGRRGSRDDVLRADVEVVEADRGGQVTYHGPGQLVGYPIVSLGPAPDLVAYVRGLEEVLIRTLQAYDIGGIRVDGRSGVWVGLEKVAAIGVRVTRGVTKHGYGLNVAPDLSYFTGIVPCGITDRGVTSIQALTGIERRVEDVARDVERAFAAVFGFTLLEAVA